MSNNIIKISIITPSYNQGDFIEDAIKSVLEQKYSNFEHIIIDNCSTDNTINILKKYPHLKWYSEPDKGQSNALNKGFKQATGNIIGWLNADDYYLPDTFNIISEKLAQCFNIDVLYGNWNFVDTNKKFIKKGQVFPFDYNMLVYYYTYIGSTSIFFRNSIITEGYFINENFKYVMDGEWYVRLASHGKKFGFINKTLACFRIHGLNQSFKYRELDNNIDKVLIRAKQLAERYAIKRFYGHKLGNDFAGSMIEELSYRILWWYYRYKSGITKLIYKSIIKP